MITGRGFKRFAFFVENQNMKEELKAFLNKYSAAQVTANIDAAVELQIFYKAAFNKNIDCLTCDGKMNKAYNELVQYLNSNIIHTMSENFKLKPGQQIFLHSIHEVIHEKNLASDEQAIELISKNKGLIAAFESYPEDWEKKVDAFIKSESQSVKAPVTISAPESETGEPNEVETPVAPGKNHNENKAKAKHK
jgi:hypothetical protein